MRRGERAERIGQRRMAAALDDQPRAALEQRRRGVGQQVEALLRVEPADHPDDRPVVVGIEPDARQQVGAAGGLAGPVGARVRRGEVRVGRPGPRPRVEPVEDPDEPVALPRSSPSRPIPNSGVSASRAYAGETVLTISAASMAAASRSMPSAFWPGRRPRSQAELGRSAFERPAVVRQVVERRDERRPPTTGSSA